jgi:hypothetical protein
MTTVTATGVTVTVTGMAAARVTCILVTVTTDAVADTVVVHGDTGTPYLPNLDRAAPLVAHAGTRVALE